MRVTIDAVQQHSENLAAMRYLTAAGLVVILFDFVESFPDELELVWKGRVGIERTLFLIHRHFSTAGLICAAQMTSGFVDMSDGVCCFPSRHFSPM
ncbi:hypothetical protein AURDEDRAFT_167543 [Auricularia subglabra TFB-10046 SS5]|nr:hypothetical protein AURDEDRAFT_167543 [Auricularia subglabra TFB-10046 SS5]